MVVMKFLFVMSTLQIVSIASKKLDTSSDESIENILLYKDFRPKPKELPPMPVEPMVAPPPPKQPECIPRMCCSMSCTNSCAQNEMSPENPNQRMPMQPNHMGSMNQMGVMSQMGMNPMGQMNPMNPGNSMNVMNSPPMPRAAPGYNSPFSNRHNKKKKLPSIPVPTRRDNSDAREHIKSLISQDQDIKKILKDLVRVTMKKVDLLELIKTRRAEELRAGASLHIDGVNNRNYEDDTMKEL